MHSLKEKSFTIILILSLFCSCKKDETNNNSTDGGGGSVGGLGNVGNLIINIKWSSPQPVLACPITSFIDVEIDGPTSNFAQTYTQVSPIRIDKRLTKGKYTYTIRKKPNTSCFTFTPIVKTGSFSIEPCSGLCGNATLLNFTLD